VPRELSALACCAALVLGVAAAASASHGVGTDLASLNLCLYGDCEARGTYAADPYNLYNPGTLAVATHMYFARGVVPSGSYYRLDVGGVDADIAAGVATVAYAPFAFQAATVYGEARGAVRRLPGVALRFRTRAVRLAAAVDAERTLGLRGLNVGLAGVVPGTTSDLRLRAGGLTLLEATETRAVELVPGVHWHGGPRDWFMVGAFLDVTRNDVDARGLDPVTGGRIVHEGTANAWIARAGVSLLPFVPTGLADGTSAAAGWLGAVRVAVDVEHRNVSVPAETGRRDTTAYFGADAPLLPAGFDPLARWLAVRWTAGVDTAGGWGAGAGLYGRGPLRFLACNPAFSDRPLTEFLGARVRTVAVTCSVVVPL
jgi:hypothetical protein